MTTIAAGVTRSPHPDPFEAREPRPRPEAAPAPRPRPPRGRARPEAGPARGGPGDDAGRPGRRCPLRQGSVRQSRAAGPGRAATRVVKAIPATYSSVAHCPL